VAKNVANAGVISAAVSRVAVRIIRNGRSTHDSQDGLPRAANYLSVGQIYLYTIRC
jgi:hypothetical protein